MSSGTAFSGSTPISSIAQQGNSLGDFVVWRWAMLTLWLVAAALFLGRAIAGYFARPLSSLGLIAVATILVVIVIELRRLLRGSQQSGASAPKVLLAWLAQLLPTLGAILLATGFTVAGAYPTGLVLLWVLVAGEALFGAGGPWTRAWVQRGQYHDQMDRGTIILDHPRGTIKEEALAKPAAPELREAALPEPVARTEFSAEDESTTADDLPWLWQDITALQELRYMTLPEQGLCVAGSQRITFPAAQQSTVVHTVFHPPFVAAPVVTVEMQEPDAVTIKAAQILPHGIRWELKAEQPAEQPRVIQWAFTATSR